MRTSLYKLLGSTLALTLALPVVAGCDPDAAVAETGVAPESLGETRQALSCVDASCTGLSPGVTSCPGSASVQGSQTVYSQFGSPVGTIQLYYSTVCHTIWGVVYFSASHGSGQLCAVDNTNVSQPPQCVFPSASASSATTPMQFLRVGDTGSASIFVGSPTFGSGGTGFYTRTL